MSKALFLNIPAHGHVNPTLGLVNELINRGEEVTYFSCKEFKERIENEGAIFKDYDEITDVFKDRDDTPKVTDMSNLLKLIDKIFNSGEEIIASILKEIKGIKFDYIIYGSGFFFGKIISQILGIPAISSFAIFATPKEVMPKFLPSDFTEVIEKSPLAKKYKGVKSRLMKLYGIEMPEMIEMFSNKGDLNIAYTSKYFVSHLEYYDDNFIFIGPPIYNRKETIDFPFEKLEGKKVVYISLGTMYNNTNNKLYQIFFDTFADYDAVIVMAAYNIDISQFDIPKNFIVRNYVPQSEILKYTDVAITHAGMNSTSDLLYNNVPYVAIPIGADQPYMAKRASELGATISLDKDKLNPEILRSSVEKVLRDPSYLENIKKISNSFKEAGGYKKAADEIFKLKARKEIQLTR